MEASWEPQVLTPQPQFPATPFSGCLGTPGSQPLAFIFPDLLPQLQIDSHLDDKSAQDYRAEDEVAVDACKDVPLSMDLSGIDFIEELHQHKGVEDDGIVLAGW